MDEQLKKELRRLDTQFAQGAISAPEWQKRKDAAFEAARARESQLAKTILAASPL